MFCLLMLTCDRIQSQIIIHNGQTARMRYCSRPTFSKTEVSQVSGNYADPPNNTDSSFNFRIYFPDTAKDNLSRRPFVMLIHGGAFQTGSLGQFDELSKFFAQRGFVAATINYRIKPPWQTGNCLPDDTVLLYQNYYRSIQDARAAMRYLLHHAPDFRIDTSWMFVGGQSAGAITALAVAFEDQQELNAFTNLEGTLGDIDHADNALTDHFTIKGVMDEAGAIKFPEDIDANENIGVISFHATLDPVVPYGLNYMEWGDCGSAYTLVNGSGVVQQRLSSLGICGELNKSFSSNHGGLAGNDYKVRHAACFFGSVMNGSCLTDSFIIEDNISPECCIKVLGTGKKDIQIGESNAAIYYTQGQLVIEFADDDAAEYSAGIFNVWGMKIAQFSHLEQGENRWSLQLASGIYFLTLNKENHNVITKKLLCVGE